MDEHPHVYLLASLLDDRLADPAVVSTEQDSKLEFLDISFPEPERVTERCGFPSGHGGHVSRHSEDVAVA